jgi:predicted ATPase/class 3 adenylate cyclase
MAGERPSGTITFLFTDIEGSTSLWEEAPDDMRAALARHDAIMRESIQARGGYVFKTMGDSFLSVFPLAADALMAAAEAQSRLAAADWTAAGLPRPLKARIAVHSGAAEERGGDYYGQSLNRAARILSAGWGGQVLASLAAAELARDSLPDGYELLDLGERRLKDLVRPERIFQLGIKGLRGEFPELKTLDSRPHNLPMQASSFVGREREQKEIEGLLMGEGASRLVTLLGAGGAGKTRLSLQVSAELIERFPEGAWFIDLAPLRSADAVPKAAARALGIQEREGTETIERIRECMKYKKALVIVDNCEHLVQAAAALAQGLLSAGTGVSLIATSREALRIPGEAVYPVPPLSLPGGEARAGPEALSQFESVRLFIERARAAAQTFEVSSANAPAIAEICCRLDGMPLAIELAAAKTRLLSADEILARLGDRFKLLTGGSRTALPRQQTLRALIDWSYDLLDADERSFLHRLSVFRGGFSLEAAETICGEGLDALDLMDRLASKSLVFRDGSSRYRLLETIREYAVEKAQDSGRALMPRFFGYFAAVVAKDADAKCGPELARRLAALAPEHDNLREALEWSLRHEPERGLKMAADAASYWWMRGHNAEGLGWLEAFLAAAPGAERGTRAAALMGLANMVHQKSDFIGALGKALESLEIFRSLGSRRGEADALRLSGLAEWSMVYSMRDDESMEALVRSARGHFRALMEICAAEGDAWGRAEAISGLAMIAMSYDMDFAAAEAMNREALAIRTSIGDLSGMGWSRHSLADCLSTRPDRAPVEAELAEALKCFARSGDPWGRNFALQFQSACFIEDGRWAEADSMLAECAAISRALGDAINLGWVRLAIVTLRMTEGRLEEAEAGLEEAGADIAASSFPALESERAILGVKLLLLRGDLPGARAALARLRPAAPDARCSLNWYTRRLRILCAVYRGWIELREGRSPAALRILAGIDRYVAEGFPFFISYALLERDRFEGELAASMGPEAFAAAMAEVRASASSDIAGLAFDGI